MGYISVGTTITYKEGTTKFDAVCTSIKNGMYQFICFAKKYETRPESLITDAMFDDSVLSTLGYKVVSSMNNNFFTLDQLFRELKDYEDIKLLGIGYDYGTEYWDDPEEDERAQHVFLFADNEYLDIVIPRNLYLNKNNHISYVYVQRKDNIKDLGTKDCSKYVEHFQAICPQPLEEFRLIEFLDKKYNSDGMHEDFDCLSCHGIDLDGCLIYDFYDDEKIIMYGNGIID